MNQPSRRTSPLFSPISIAISVVFIIGFGVFTLLSGGLGFSPGPVSAKSVSGVVLQNTKSHADFEDNCSLCHQPLQKDQAVLCMNCHSDIATQVQSKQGLHGRLDNVNQCATCHAEHKGRNFDPTSDAVKTFDHNLTGFSLAGKHSQIQCDACHLNNRYDQAQPTCVSCHTEPQVHAGLLGTDCETCHNSNTWKPASFQGKPFDHSQIRFKLNLHAVDYSGNPITCNSCHSGDPAKTTTTSCVQCHSNHDQVYIQKHVAQYGSECMTCHDGVDRLKGWTHAVSFPLNGKHATIACTDCHKNNVYRGTASKCSDCHQESKIHAGFFGTRCEYCHTANAWSPAPLREHTFPIDHGGKGEVACATCHTGAYQVNTCYGCHDHVAQEIVTSHAKLNLTQTRLDACTDCHMNGKVNQ